jgi:DNA primase
MNRLLRLNEGGQMHKIPEDVIAAVLSKTNIVDVVSKHVHLTKQGKYLKGLCPFHSEKTPSFTVTPEKQIFHCYGCGKGGSAIKFVMEIEGVSFQEAVRQLAEDAGVPVTWDDRTDVLDEHAAERKQLLDAHEIAAKWFHYILMNTEQGRPALEYLRDRGFSDKLISAFQIGYAPQMYDALTQFLHKRDFPLQLMERGGLIALHEERNQYYDRFRDRVMFPLHDSAGRIIAFAGRALGDLQPKYLNTPESFIFHKSRLLYQLHQAKPEIRKTGQIVLFEGYVDVIKAWEAGVRNGVASMGTALTDEHVKLMKRHASRVVICYDGDDAGVNAAYKSLSLLEKAGLAVNVAVIPDRMDPDEYITRYGGERFRSEIIQGAVSAIRFKLDYLRRGYRLNTEDGRLKYIRAALRIIASMRSPVEREYYLKDLASEYQVSLDTLKQEALQMIEASQKMEQNGDNIGKPWNNGMNDRREVITRPALRPAYYNAERNLLAAMLQDANIASLVQERLGADFNVEAHAALAAYIYRYYTDHDTLELSTFMAMLQDEELERLVSSLSMEDIVAVMNERALEDHIRQIRKAPMQLAIEQKKEELHRAERSGNVQAAVQIASEIMTLEKQLKDIQH